MRFNRSRPHRPRHLLAWICSTILALFVGSVLAGFAWRPAIIDNPNWEPPVGPMEFNGGYRLADFLGNPRAQVMTALAFSGGGKGSAAFAHGVLRGMADIPVPNTMGEPLSLLDQVEYISSVSGGSFAAAHYAAFRRQSFDTFPDFLHADIDAEIRKLYLMPWHWIWLMRGGASDDYMAEVYDRLLFHGKTYSDLVKLGAPVVSVNATDLGTGAVFPFTQEGFDLICASLSPFPIARAVAASNGLPILFSPINLPSHRPDCPPVAVPEAPPNATLDEQRRASYLRSWVARFSDAERVRYLHLVDGGVADNLALRTLLNIVLTADLKKLPRTKIASTRRLLLISVDGESANSRMLSQEPKVSGLSVLAATVSGIMVDRYNFDTMVLAQSEMAQLVLRLRAARCALGPVLNGHPCEDVEGLVVHLDLSLISDPVVRARLLATPLALTLPNEEVDLLVEWGQRVVRDDPQIKKFLAGL